MKPKYLSITFLSLFLMNPVFCAEAPAPQRFKPQFVDVPLEVLAEAVTTATGKTFVIQPGIHFTVTLKSDRSLSSEEMYAQFRRVLDELGLGALLQRGGYIKIVRDPHLMRT